MTDRYTYTIVVGGLSSEIIPDKAPEIEWEDEDGEEKRFKRKKISNISFSREYPKDDGTLHIGNGYMFAWIWNLYFNPSALATRYTINITDELTGVTEYSGYFTLNDVALNVESQTITIKPTVNDRYTWILAKEDYEVDVVDSAVGTAYRTTYEYDVELDQRYIYNYATYASVVLGVTPDSWRYTENAGAVGDFSESGGAWDGTGYLFERLVSRYPQDTKTFVGHPIGHPIGDLFGWEEYSDLVPSFMEDAESYWANPEPDPVTGWDVFTVRFEFPNARKLIPEYTQRDDDAWVVDEDERGIIQYLLDELYPRTGDHGLVLKSKFFSDTTNYVTLEANRLMNMLVNQKSDAANPSNSNKATIGKVTFKKLMESLSRIFNVAWYIDDDGYLRIEHISFFENGLQISGSPSICVNLVEPLSKYKEPFTGEGYYVGHQDYENNIEVPVMETWTFMEEYSREHRSDKNFIEYDTRFPITGSPKDRSISNVTTDIRYILKYPSKISDDGFVFSDIYSFDGYYDRNVNYIKVGWVKTLPSYADASIYFPNKAFSQEDLIRNYWYHYRPFIEGVVTWHGLKHNVDGTFITQFNTTENKITQKDVMFLLNSLDTFQIQKYIRNYRYEYSTSGTDPNGRFSLVADDGEIKSAKLDLETGYYIVDLAYGIY